MSLSTGHSFKDDNQVEGHKLPNIKVQDPTRLSLVLMSSAVIGRELNKFQDRNAWQREHTLIQLSKVQQDFENLGMHLENNRLAAIDAAEQLLLHTAMTLWKLYEREKAA